MIVLEGADGDGRADRDRRPVRRSNRRQGLGGSR